LSGSNNPIGFKSCDFITFAPNFLIKDFFGFMVYLGFFFAIISYYPNTLGHPDNYIKANSLKTPLHVVPE
jgi:ubiquinol-cytochrome c reductase cytochrome b subunit